MSCLRHFFWDLRVVTATSLLSLNLLSLRELCVMSNLTVLTRNSHLLTSPDKFTVIFCYILFWQTSSCGTGWRLSYSHTFVRFVLPTCYNSIAVFSTQSHPAELFRLVALGIPLHYKTCLLPRSFRFSPGDGDTVLTQSFERNLERFICWARGYEWERVNHTQTHTYFPEWLKNNQK